MLARFKNGDLQVVVVVPDGVSSAATSAGKASQVEVYYDPSNQTTSQIVLTIVRQVVDGFDRQLSQRPTLFTVQAQPITSESLRAIDFLLPGILAMSLMQLGLFATAPALVQLREQQVLRRMGLLRLPSTTLLAAQVTYRLRSASLQTFIIIVAGVLCSMCIWGATGRTDAVVLWARLCSWRWVISFRAWPDAGERDRNQPDDQLPDDVFVGIFFR